MANNRDRIGIMSTDGYTASVSVALAVAFA